MALLWELAFNYCQIQVHRCSIRTCLQDDGFGNLIDTWPGYSGQPPASFSQATGFFTDATQYDMFYDDYEVEL